MNEIKMRTILSLAVLVSIGVTSTYAQSISPQAITSSGKSMSNSNGKINSTVGEITVKPSAENKSNMSSGFSGCSSGSCLVLAVKEPDVEQLTLKVYPNPTTDLLYADISDSKLDFIELTVCDLTGKIISSNTYSAGNNHISINTTNWQVGTYFIKVSDKQKKEIANYKIVKQ